MKFITSILILVLLLVVTLSQTCCEADTVKVSGSADIKVKPDTAKLKVQISVDSKTSSQALTEANKQIAQVISILKQNGVQNKDYSTSSFQINPKIDYINGTSTVTAQTAAQTLSITIYNLTSNGSKIEKFIDQFSLINGVSVTGLTFSQNDTKLSKKQARQAAFENAKKKANEYAILSGLKLQNILKISDVNSNSITPIFLDGTTYKATASLGSAISIGQILVSAAVDTIWRLK